MKQPSNKTFKSLKKLPERLKDLKTYHKIERKLFDIVQTDHKHKTVKSYVTCAWCNKKRELRGNILKLEGFKSIEQYMAWKQIMQKMEEVVNLQKEYAKTKKV